MKDDNKYCNADKSSVRYGVFEVNTNIKSLYLQVMINTRPLYSLNGVESDLCRYKFLFKT